MNSYMVKETAYKLGADICNIADITRFSEAPEGFGPTDILENAKSVIVIGNQFSKSVFESKTMCTYYLVRERLRMMVDNIAVDLSLAIEKDGGTAVPIPSSEPYEFWDSEKREGRGILSLKHAAAMAGMGSIGKNTLLVNEKYGNRLWLGAVVTNIRLESDRMTDNLCYDNCSKCLDACPQKALDGVTIEQKKCREICGKYTEGGGFYYSCNICRKVCPYSAV